MSTPPVNTGDPKVDPVRPAPIVNITAQITDLDVLGAVAYSQQAPPQNQAVPYFDAGDATGIILKAILARLDRFDTRITAIETRLTNAGL